MEERDVVEQIKAWSAERDLAAEAGDKRRAWVANRSLSQLQNLRKRLGSKGRDYRREHVLS